MALFTGPGGAALLLLLRSQDCCFVQRTEKDHPDHSSGRLVVVQAGPVEVQESAADQMCHLQVFGLFPLNRKGKFFLQCIRLIAIIPLHKTYQMKHIAHD